MRFTVHAVKSVPRCSLDVLFFTKVANADCAAERLEPPITWINGALLNKGVSGLGLTTIEPIWTSEYTYPASLPDAGFISGKDFGVAEASFVVAFNDSEDISNILSNNRCFVM